MKKKIITYNNIIQAIDLIFLTYAISFILFEKDLTPNEIDCNILMLIPIVIHLIWVFRRKDSIYTYISKDFLFYFLFIIFIFVILIINFPTISGGFSQ
jgi:hypothetical protein